MLNSRRGDRNDERGQIIVLFALSLVVMMAMGALLFSGAQTLVLRRQLQNAGDAAALAGANLVVYDDGCSATEGGTARSAIVTAVKNSISTNLPTYDLNNVVVTCPTGYSRDAVQVTLNGTGRGFFGGQILNVATKSVALNGQVGNGGFSVVLLDPSNPSWRSNRSGCPSFTINGGITGTFEGSIMVDSLCTLADSSSGDFKALNSAFSMVMTNSSSIRLAGEYAVGTGTHVTPLPIQDARPIQADPLSGLIRPCNSSDTPSGGLYSCVGTSSTLPTVNMASTGQGICKNQDPCILTPGTYSGGILAANGNGASTLLLRPGVYYVKGGGVQLKSGAGRIFAIPNSTSYPDATAKTDFAITKTDAQVEVMFETKCAQPTVTVTTTPCGVLLYNAPSSTSWNTNQDAVANGSQGVLELRAYNPANDTTSCGATTCGTLFGNAGYKNLVIWQARQPAPSGSGQTQPTISLHGNGCVTVSGTLYASGGPVLFGGTTCGNGGGDASLTLQFICWDLTLDGNNNFAFLYNKDWFTVPTTYGLIQ